MKDENRINFLDSLRGVAIILVILFHAYARWPNLYPYGDTFSNFPLFKFGWLGVELFFLISGFVILMTLEKCIGFNDFILRRWFRLFPAMLACSLFIYTTAPFFFERPSGRPSFLSILPGLTFIEPDRYNKIFDLSFDIGQLEGAFWSLYVEIKFYIIFGFLYFFVGSRIAILGLIGFFSLAMISLTPNYPNYIDYEFIKNVMFNWLNADYYGWFASGALFYKYYQTKNRTVLLCAILIGFYSAMLFNGHHFDIQFCSLLIVLFFALAITNNKINSLLNRKIFIFIGFISYPLYLLHENIMVSLILKTGKLLPWIPAITVPIMPILMIIIIGSIFAFYVEPMAKNLIKPGYRKFRELCLLPIKVN